MRFLAIFYQFAIVLQDTSTNMPPKSKRKLQLEAARARKVAKLGESSERRDESSVSERREESHGSGVERSGESSASGMREETSVSLRREEGPESEISSDECDDADFNPNESVTTEEQQALALQHIEEWVSVLPRDDVMSLSLTLHHVLVNVHGVKKVDAAQTIAEVTGKGKRTIGRWRKLFYDNAGTFPDSEQGHYQRQGVLWSDEELCEAARTYIRQNAVVKGRPNMNAVSFTRWVNDHLLPNSILEPGFPRHIGVETGRKWLHELGFEVLNKKKGVYIDGHERGDVVEHRKKFLRQLVAGGFLTKDGAPNDEAKNAFPDDIESPSAERRQKNIFIFHDETTFNANDDESLQWGTPDSQLIRPKSRGSGIMVSDFITERDGFLCLTEEEYQAAKRNNPNIRMSARKLLEYGESREGYWTSEKFMKQMENAVEVAEAKYPKEQGYRLFWVFDQSSCHGAYSDDALNANKMNAKPGGKQPLMHDTVYNGKPQSMKKRILVGGHYQWIPKGLIEVLTERGCYNRTMKLEDMRKEIATHPDFKNEKTVLERFINNRGHAFLFIPKYHCELNAIERCWSQAKRYTRAYCNYSITGLRRNIPESFDTISVENIQNYFRQARQYMYGYLLGHQAGIELEQLVKNFSKQFKSHRRVAEGQ